MDGHGHFGMGGLVDRRRQRLASQDLPKPSLPAIRASFSLGLSLSLSSGSLTFPSVTETSTQLAPRDRVKVPRDSPAPLPRLQDRSLLAGLMSVRDMWHWPPSLSCLISTVWSQ